MQTMVDRVMREKVRYNLAHLVYLFCFKHILQHLEIRDKLVFVFCIHFNPDHWQIA